MSLYNMIKGFDPACLWIMPMLGRHQEDWPRFRDCFVEDNTIVILTRVGGGNRDTGYGEDELYKDPNFISTYDDEYDSTYGYYVFKVPDEWKEDFDKLRQGKFAETSKAYQGLMRSFWPTLNEKGFFDTVFNK